jgi:hypothetical protein
MNVGTPEALLLIEIDVAQASIGGGGTAMRFVLPVHATTKAQDMWRANCRRSSIGSNELFVIWGRSHVAECLCYIVEKNV